MITTTPIVDSIEDMLKRHKRAPNIPRDNEGDVITVCCTCGWQEDIDTNWKTTYETYRRHLAEAIHKELF